MSEPTPQDDVTSSDEPRLDPWIEQERRLEEYRRARRRTRMVRVGAVAGLVLVIGAVTGAILRADAGGDDSRDVVPTSLPASTSPIVATPVDDGEPPDTVAVDELIRIEESWLLASPDGVYDWGVVVSVPAGAPTRSEVELDVRLVAADDTLVEATSFSFEGVGADAPAVGSGRLRDPLIQPVRIEFDVAPGRESDDLGLDDVLSMRALERSGDTLTGRIRAVGPDAVDAVGALFVWRDDEDAVVAAVPLEIERVRLGIDARFELDLSDEEIPVGPPDTTLWTP